MPAKRMKSGDGGYCVDWDGVHSLLRSWAYAVSTLEYASEKVEKDKFGPDLYSVEIDWEKVRREANKISDAEYQNYRKSAASAMQPILQDLASKMAEAAEARRSLTERMHSAQRKTMRNVEASVHIGEIGVEVATKLRNLSAEGLMFGAGIFSGGTAIALAGGGGALLKGFGTYQDAGYTHAGHAVATFTAELVMTVFLVGKAKFLKGVADAGVKLFFKLCFVKVEAGMDGAKAAWIEGKRVNAALLDGANSFFTSDFAEIAKEALPEKWVLPVQFVAKQAISHSLDKIEDKSEKKDEVGPNFLSPPHQPQARPHALMDAAVFNQSHIKQIAIRKTP